MKALLETRELTKAFGPCVAVSNVSATFAPGRIHAILGENGAGKSTLLKLLFGLYQPTSGEIFLDGQRVRWKSPMDAIRNGLGMVQQHFTLVETLSAIDNIMLGAEVSGRAGHLDRAAAIAHIEKLLPGPQLAVPWEAKVSELSVGFRQRIEILKLLFREARILFLDEPTAVLAPQEIHDFFEVLRALKAAGRTIVLISHKIGDVFQLCDTYTILRGGRLIAQGEIAETTPDQIVESMIGRQLVPLGAERQPRGEEVMLYARDVQEEGEHRGRLKGINLDVHAGEIVGVAGVEGSGQSTFVEAIMGLRRVRGELTLLKAPVRLGATADVRRRGVALVPEDRLAQALWAEESCYANMTIGLEDRFVRHGVFNEAKVEEETSQWANSYDVRAASLSVAAGSLSGGNQQKLIFAREVAGRRPKFLICHQPTRGVDLGAVELIHSRLLALRDRGLGVLVISSELDELMALCDRIFVFFEGRVQAEFARAEFDRLKIGAAMTGVNDWG
ncbi:MAG: ABC transporter ATP-binding protein [Bdellovibrionaceae bacterium]|nr:ABC transporter ATP-binding protein [Pseudobdellovibrionaceae bacterium]